MMEFDFKIWTQAEKPQGVKKTPQYLEKIACLD